MSTIRSLAGITAALTLAVLAACGGGGGGDGDSVVPLSYSGSTSAAAVTAGNAAKLTANVIGGEDAAAIIGPLSVAPTGPVQAPSIGFAEVARSLNRTFRDTLMHAERTNAAQPLKSAAIPVNEIVFCDFGSVRITGTLSDVGTGTLNVTYSGCTLNGLTLNGPATMRIDVFDLFFFLPTDFTVSFPRMTLRAAGVSSDAGGSLRVQLFIGSNTETLTLDTVALDNNTGDMTKSENFVLTTVYDNIFSPSSFTESISGVGVGKPARSFDAVHGFVEVTTPTPLSFGTLDQLFPDSGQILLTGAGNRRISATALSATLVRLELDLDGDGAFENVARLKWTDLSGPVAADLADDDGDGMHNSWEAVNGLDPSDPADAGLDNDVDGPSNLIEYQNGTDPNDPASTSPFAGQVIELVGNSDLIFDSGTQKIYASVRGNPGAIVPIDPATGNAGPPIPVGIDPVKLARSDNGQYLYVGLDGENAVQRIDLATQMVNLTISLGSDSTAAFFVEDLAVLPGVPQSIAVSRRYKPVSPRHAGVAIFDDGVQRPAATPGHTGSNAIEFSASAGTLYGYNNETTEFGFRRMAVDPSGVSVSDVFDSFMGDLISGFGVDIRFHGGLIYTTTGRVIDPVARTIVGTFSLPGTFGNFVEPDAAIGRVFFLSAGTSGAWTIRAFDLNTRQFLESEDIAGVTGNPSSLIRWGAKGLAFRTSDGQIFLIQSSKLIP